jgi:hypothetical protein
MNGEQAVEEALRQMIDGRDYTPVERLVADLTPDHACRKPPRSPYSIATVVWHTWFWVNVWAITIRGAGDPFGGHDPGATWPDVPPEDWPATRERLRESLRQASALSVSEDPDRPTWGEGTVGKNLLQIAIHTAYHIGQIALLRLELGLWPPAAGE